MIIKYENNLKFCEEKRLNARNKKDAMSKMIIYMSKKKLL